VYPGVAGSSHNAYQFWVVSRSLPFDDLGEYQTAITDYTKAIQLDPDYAKAYNNRA
jgi:tetratricopeptide (TPR) repeat protein